MEELQKNLEEALKYIDILNDRYKDANIYIGQLKDKIYLRSKKDSTKLVKDSDEVSRLNKENEKSKHEL